jgi:hypothetical protein
MENCIWLRSAGIEVGIAPHLAGTVSHYRRCGAPNCLLFDEAMLAHAPERRFSARATALTYNGHTVWLAPQRLWWSQQTANPERRRRLVAWPPDPWLTRGAYAVVAQTRQRVELLSLRSPISLIQLRKVIRLDREGRVHFQVTAENIGDRPVSWGLWCNTRVDAYARCWVPLRDNRRVHLESSFPALEATIEDGCFSFLPKRPRRGQPDRFAKAYMHPRRAAILADTPGGRLLIEADNTPSRDCAPGHRTVEIYNACNHDPATSLLELEWHAPYKTLKPGGRMRAAQRWSLLPDTGSLRAARRALVSD